MDKFEKLAEMLNAELIMDKTLDENFDSTRRYLLVNCDGYEATVSEEGELIKDTIIVSTPLSVRWPSSNVILLLQEPVLITNGGRGFVVDMKTGTVAFNTPVSSDDPTEDELEMIAILVKGMDALFTRDFLLYLTNPVVRLEVPDTEELKNRLRALFMQEIKLINEHIDIETAKRTAELRTKIRRLEAENDKLKKKVANMEDTVYDTVEDILSFVAEGWKLLKLGDELFLYYPKIVPNCIVRGEKVLTLKEDHPFFIEGLLIPVRPHVHTAYCVKHFHPNVDTSHVSLYDKKVHKICLGDLSGKPFAKVATEIKLTLQTINLGSAFPNAAAEKATEIFDNFEKKSTWEVMENEEV